MRKGKTIVFCIDALSINYVESLVRIGLIPTIDAYIKRNGYSSPIINLSERGWPQIFTGRPASDYEGYYYKVNQSNYDFFESFSFDDYYTYSIWTDKSLKIVTIGVPTTFPPPKEYSGTIVSAGSAGQFPKDIKEIIYTNDDRIINKMENYLIDVRSNLCSNVFEYLSKLEELVVQKMEFILDLLDSSNDLLICGIIGFDRIGHDYWPYIDGAADRKKMLPSQNEVFEKIRNYFETVDKYFQKIEESLSANDKIIIISDHGMIGRSGTIFINKLLIDLGFASYSKNINEWFMGNLRNFVVKNVGPKIRDILKSVNDKYSKLPLNRPHLDMKKTTAFGMYNHGIYINKKEKYIDGIVPDGEVEDVIDKIIYSLEKWEKDNQEKVFKKIINNMNNHGAPDILISLKDGIEMRGEIEKKSYMPFSKTLYNINEMPIKHQGIHYEKAIFSFNSNEKVTINSLQDIRKYLVMKSTDSCHLIKK